MRSKAGKSARYVVITEDDYFVQDLEKILKGDVTYITSRQCLDGCLKKKNGEQSLFRIFNGKSKAFLLIVPEITWDTPFCGYKIAAELLSGSLSDTFIQLIFISRLTEQILKKLVDIEYRSFADTFPHIIFPEGQNNFEDQIKNTEYSEIHFQLAKQMALNHSYRLSYLWHDAGSRLRSKGKGVEQLKEEAKDLLDRLGNTYYLELLPELSEGLQSMRQEIANTTSSDVFPSIAARIEEYSRKLLDLLKDPQGNSPRNSTFPYNVLIVDDDKTSRDTLVEYFRGLSPREDMAATVDAYGTDEIKKAREKLEKEAQNYDFIILDLLFKKDDAWLPFNGIDLYSIIRRVNRFCVIRVITALPRAMVSHLAHTLIGGEQPVIFTKSNGVDQLIGAIDERLCEIQMECRINQDLKSLSDPFYPVNKPFNEPYVRWYIKNHELEFKDAMDKAVKAADSAESDLCITLPSYGKKNHLELVIRHLPDILTFRRVIIKHVVDQHDYSLASIGDTLKSYNLRKEAVDQSVLCSKLGFSTSGGGDLELINLFPEEMALVNPQGSFEFSNEKCICSWIDKIQDRLFLDEEYHKLKKDIFGDYFNGAVFSKEAKDIKYADFICFLQVCMRNLDRKVDNCSKTIRQLFQENDVKITGKPVGMTEYPDFNAYFAERFPLIGELLSSNLVTNSIDPEECLQNNHEKNRTDSQ